MIRRTHTLVNRPTSLRLSLLGLLVAAAGVAAPSFAGAQTETQDWLEQCQRNRGTRATHCEVREHNLPASSALDVSASPNGGIQIRSWDRREVLVRSRIQATAPSEAEARGLAGDISISTGGNRVRAEGPSSLGRDRGWSVSFEVFVPRDIDLELSTVNGGISVQSVNGRLSARTTNGGIRMEEVSGDVRGRTTNGGVSVHLSGSRWNGTGLDLSTTNGGIEVRAPRGYSADVQAQTRNGGITTDFPMTVQGRVGRRLEGAIGQGGAPLRLSTTNGSIRIREN